MNYEQKITELQNKLEEIMKEYPEFKVFMTIFHKDGEISWTLTESLCLACVIEWLNELAEDREIKHLDNYEVH